MQALYTIEGKVIEGKKRGRTLGFPTANVSCSTEIPSGIYISQTLLDNSVYPSITFIGEAKTFNENLFQAETYILDFQKEIYGEKIVVNLLKKIRDNQIFSNTEDLIKQMEEDKRLTQNFFKNSPS